MVPAFFAPEVTQKGHRSAQSSAFKSAVKSETLRKEGNPPSRASCIAAAVVAFGAFTSKGRAFSAATRVSRTRTVSDTERPMDARALAARAFVRLSVRT